MQEARTWPRLPPTSLAGSCLAVWTSDSHPALGGFKVQLFSSNLPQLRLIRLRDHAMRLCRACCERRGLELTDQTIVRHWGSGFNQRARLSNLYASNF